MTIEQTATIMDILEVAYPRFYINQNENDKYKASALWAEMFINDDIAIVAGAVKSFIATDTKGFPPHIGAIKEAIYKITAPKEMSELEAWVMVRKALGNGSYNAQIEFDYLPSILKRVVGSPATLREWAAMEADVVDSVVASNFQRSYKAIAKTEKEYALIPQDVKNIVNQFAEKFSIENRLLSDKKLEAQEQKNKSQLVDNSVESWKGF